MDIHIGHRIESEGGESLKECSKAKLGINNSKIVKYYMCVCVCVISTSKEKVVITINPIEVRRIV